MICTIRMWTSLTLSSLHVPASLHVHGTHWVYPMNFLYLWNSQNFTCFNLLILYLRLFFYVFQIFNRMYKCTCIINSLPFLFELHFTIDIWGEILHARLEYFFFKLCLYTCTGKYTYSWLGYKEEEWKPHPPRQYCFIPTPLGIRYLKMYRYWRTSSYLSMHAYDW